MVGSVDAVELVTVGQRRGLRLAGGEDRRFVVDVDVPRRTVTVGSGDSLACRTVTLCDMVWATGSPMGEMDTDIAGGALTAQTSAHGAAHPITVRPLDPNGSSVELRWAEPRPRVAPGQSVVIYQRDEVVGGGVVVDRQSEPRSVS